MTGGPAPRGRLLVYRALGLGDLLTAVPALRALADAFPCHQKVLATPAGLAPLALLTGAVDEVLDTPFATLPPLPPKAFGADVAVNLHGRGPRSTVVLAATEPARLIAFAPPAPPKPFGRDFRSMLRKSRPNGPVWRADEHEVRRWCRLLAESGIPADPSRLDLDPSLIGREPPAAARGATVVHPGASSPERWWPAERWAEVARRVGPVVITGSAAEADRAHHIARLAGVEPDRVLAGRTDVMGLAAVVAASSRVLSADTGVAHLATALRTPSVVLFGPAHPDLWGPPPDRPWHKALWRGPAIEAIEVDDVLAAAA